MVQVLRTLTGLGSFCCGGEFDASFPWLMIDGLAEPLSLPLTAIQAKALVEHCSLAPFGKGSETVLDLNVRKTWQLEPSNFRVSNLESWQRSLQKLIRERVADELEAPMAGLCTKL